MRRIAATIALVGIFAYWSRLASTGQLGAPGPGDARDGEEILLTLVAVDGIDGPDRFVVLQGAERVAVLGASAQVAVGEDVTLAGTWVEADQAIRLDWLEHAPGRGAKKRLGLVGLAFLLVALPLWFRREGRGFAIRGD